MSTKTKALALSLEEQRSRLERRANVIRSRLLRTIDALDDRRHQVQEIGHQAKRLAKPVAASLVGALVIAAGTTFAIRALAQRSREKNFSYRLAKALAPLRAEPRPSFWKQALRTMALAVVAVAASEVAKRSAHRFLQRDHGRPVALLGPGPVARPEVQSPRAV